MKKSANISEKVEHIPTEHPFNDYNDAEAQSQRTSTDVSSKKRRWSFSTSSLRSAGASEPDDPQVISKRKFMFKVGKMIYIQDTLMPSIAGRCYHANRVCYEL